MGRTDPPTPDTTVVTSPVSISYLSMSKRSVCEFWAYSNTGPGVMLRV